MIIKKDICYSKNPHELSYLDMYLPDSKPHSVIIYFHGGGIEGGKREHIIEGLNELTKEGYAVVYPDYSLYPNAKFPEFILDAAEAVNYVKKECEEFSNCQNFYVGGSSAGAYLSMMLYFDKSYLGKYGIKVSEFTGFIFDAGQPTSHYNVLRERKKDTRKVIIDETAPLFFVEEYDHEPPVVIFVAENDMVNRYEQNMLLISTMKHFNYPKENIYYEFMKNHGHCTYNHDQEFFDCLTKFIKNTVKGK